MKKIIFSWYIVALLFIMPTITHAQLNSEQQHCRDRYEEIKNFLLTHGNIVYMGLIKPPKVIGKIPYYTYISFGGDDGTIKIELRRKEIEGENEYQHDWELLLYEGLCDTHANYSKALVKGAGGITFEREVERWSRDFKCSILEWGSKIVSNYGEQNMKKNIRN